MNDIVKISVIVPVYNTANYLCQCVNSIINQTYNDLEIILVDDGSTDGSGAICDKYAELDNRIIVMHKPNDGLISARKSGLSIATGEYIGFVDSDDWIDTDMFANIVSYVFQNDSPDIVGFGLKEEYIDRSVHLVNRVEHRIYSGKEFITLKNHMIMTDVFFEWKILPHLCDKLIKTELLKRVLPDIDCCISFGEDAVTVFPCLLLADSFLSLDYAPYHYRQRDGSIVRSPEEINKANFISIYRILSKYFDGYVTLLNQLKYYLFFILFLKAYSQLNYGMLLFPFSDVQPGNRILVYGAGGFGKVINSMLNNNSDLISVGWTDKNFEHLQSQGMLVSDLSIIESGDYDHIIISILNERVVEDVKEVLIQKNIPIEKIKYLSRELLSCFELPKWITNEDDLE